MLPGTLELVAVAVPATLVALAPAVDVVPANVFPVLAPLLVLPAPPVPLLPALPALPPLELALLPPLARSLLALVLVVPLLTAVPAWFSGRVLSRHPVGDHVGFLLEIDAAEVADDVPALLTFSHVHDLDAGHAP